MDQASDQNVDLQGTDPDGKPAGWLIYLRVVGILFVSSPILALQALAIFIRWPFWWNGAALWHRTVTRMLGLQVEFTGHGFAEGPVLYASNHISWLDILVLGGHLPRASFVAKAEVETWGVIGKIASLHKTIYVDRARRNTTGTTTNELADRVAQGDSLILFPESTTTWGQHVIPFKSALFGVAEKAAENDGDMLVQPITISYVGVNGAPLVRGQKPWVAWIGDMELSPHLVQLLQRGRIKVRVELHAPIHLRDFGCRKELAAFCELKVKEGLERAHRDEHQHGPQPRHGQ